MQRLSGLDAGFLYMETPTLHMHTLKVAILEPAPDSHPGEASLPIAEVREQIGSRMHLLPPLRRRLVEVPLRLHHPVWIEDPDFAIEHHVHHVAVARPGGRAELNATIGELAGTALDRSRPLWQLYVLDGLADGRIAVLVKIHHAVADGAAAADLLANVMSTDPQVGPASEERPWQPEEQPSARQLLGDALQDHRRQLRRVPALVVRTVRNLGAVARHHADAAVRPPRPMLDTPRTSFNASLTPRRVFATAILPLEDVELVRDRHAVSVNDVVLAVTGGALRTYLAARGELPDQPLVAAVPLSTSPRGERRLAGNRVANLFTTLATDEDDAVVRLRHIHEVTAEAKLVQQLLGIDMLQDWVEYTPPGPYAWLVGQYSHRRVADRVPPPINVVISNVPGPRQPLFADGARLAELYSVGPVLEGVGVNITVWSYLDRLFVGVLGCRESLPDADELARALEESLTDLVRASVAAPPAMVGRPPDVH